MWSSGGDQPVSGASLERRISTLNDALAGPEAKVIDQRSEAIERMGSDGGSGLPQFGWREAPGRPREGMIRRLIRSIADATVRSFKDGSAMNFKVPNAATEEERFMAYELANAAAWDRLSPRLKKRVMEERQEAAAAATAERISRRKAEYYEK